VFEYSFERSRTAATPPELAARFFEDGNAWFRLNPEWEVLSFKDGRLRVRYERSEAEVEWRVATADVHATGGTIVLEGDQPRSVKLTWEPIGDKRIQLGYREEFAAPLETERLAELSVWLDAASGYLALAARNDWRARFGKWLLDKFWLKMSPTARRVGLIVIAMEALALLLFVAIVLIDRVFG
jgi:hypothetical protein